VKPPVSTLPFVSVIIPTYMRPQRTGQTILSVLASDYPSDRFEVIVVDSSPSAEMTEVILRFQQNPRDAARVHLLRKDPEGPGASWNRGVGEARGELLAFINSDCVADPGWLSRGVNCFLDQSRLGIVQGRTLPPPGNPPGIGSRYYCYDKESCIYDGCNIFYRKQAFEEVGGSSLYYYWDARKDSQDLLTRLIPLLTSFRYILEYTGLDTDLAWRVIERNWKTMFCESAVVYHDVRTLNLFRWLIDEGCYSYAFPRLVQEHPQIREYLFGRWFWHRSHVFLLFLLIGVFGGLLVHPLAMLLGLPYVYIRASEPSRFWRGVLLPLRSLVYLPRDLITMCFLLAGSIRHRTLIV